MTISERKAMLEAYAGRTRTPENFEPFWRGRWDSVMPREVQRERVPFQNSSAVYETLTILTSDGQTVRARYLRPAGTGPFPTVLMFHDLGRGVRGWHHMTRFIALGCAVAALENRFLGIGGWTDPEAPALGRQYLDAITLAQAVLALPYTDAARLVTWGEGFGGGLAVVTAALLPDGARCAALNPMPADFRGVCGGAADEALFAALDYLDTVNFAPMLRGPLLIGTGLLDTIAPPEGQYAVFNRAVCPKTHLVYPKYEHERINFFENELIKFLHV